MTHFDVSVGISPRQSFESWAAFVAGLEAEGVRRVWVIDSQLAMKDVYAGLVVAALKTTRIGLGTFDPLTGRALCQKKASSDFLFITFAFDSRGDRKCPEALACVA